MKSLFTLIAFVLLAHHIISADTKLLANISSVQNGSWHSTSTWSGGVVPTYGDDVTISHVVTVTDTAKLKNLHYATGGNLVLANFAFLKMRP